MNPGLSLFHDSVEGMTSLLSPKGGELSLEGSSTLKMRKRVQVNYKRSSIEDSWMASTDTKPTNNQFWEQKPVRLYDGFHQRRATLDTSSRKKRGQTPLEHGLQKRFPNEI